MHDWLRSARTGQLDLPHDFSWLGLAQGAAFRAQQLASQADEKVHSVTTGVKDAHATYWLYWPDRTMGNPPIGWPDEAASALEWAKISLSVYDLLESRATAGDRDSYAQSAMNLRASLIARFGVVPEHQVLDVDRVVYWFFESLRISVQEAHGRASTYRNQGMNIDNIKELRKIRELRRIKNRLAVLRLLIDSGHLDPRAGLRAWLDIEEQLP